MFWNYIKCSYKLIVQQILYKEKSINFVNALKIKSFLKSFLFLNEIFFYTLQGLLFFLIQIFLIKSIGTTVDDKNMTKNNSFIVKP